MACTCARHLIERVPITTAPSASVWLDMQRRWETPVQHLFAVGNPAFQGAGVEGDLPDAQDEVERIMDRLNWPVEATVLTGDDATEQRVKDQLVAADVVHFAAHGQLDARDPRNGHRIRLTPSAEEDGVLHAREVREIDLSRARLAVLNVCDGVVCRYGPGDEPLGLLAAFIVAGTGNVLGGLWALPDASAKIFLLDFYRGLNDADLARALQIASVRAIEKQRDLVFWAGFQLVGPGRGIQPHAAN